MTDNKNRLDYIDLARGICIYLMILGHSFTSGNNGSGVSTAYLIVYSFHMPFFFLISGSLTAYREKQKSVRSGIGVFFSDEERQMQSDHMPPAAFFRTALKKARQLLLPYVIWVVFYYGFLTVLALIGGTDPHFYLNECLSAFRHLGGGAMWFLPVFFLASIIFVLLRQLRKELLFISGVIMVICGVFGPGDNGYLQTLYKALIGCAFMVFGELLLPFFTKKIRWYWLISLLGLDSVCVVRNGTVSMAGRAYHDALLYLITSIVGSLLIVQFCMRLQRYQDRFVVRQVIRFGRFSIVPLCTHQIVLEVLHIFDHRYLDEKLVSMGVLEGLILSFVTSILIMLLMPVLLRVFGWSWGFRNGKKKSQNNKQSEEG